jgi:hypothetical protein
MAKGPTKGEVYECRVARLMHHEGAFVRRAVDLQMHFGEAFTITDVDIFAVSFTPSLQRSVAIGECKTTHSSGPSAGDRMLWGTGVRQLVPDADRHFLAVTKPASDNTRALARRLGTEVLDERDLTQREGLLGLDPARIGGPHDPDLIQLEKSAFGIAKKDDDLKRVWTFVRSDFWFSDEVYGVKRALGALRLLGRRWHPDLPTTEAAALQWLAEEAVAAVVVASVRLAGDAYRQPTQVFERHLAERLAEGIAPYHVLRDVSQELDRYVMAVLSEAGVDPARQLDRLGALDPKPPGYAEPLTEVLHRLAASPRITASLPRLYDERLAAHRGSPVPGQGICGDEAKKGAQLLQTIAAFLRGQIKVPDALMRPLSEPEPPRPAASKLGSPTSPDDDEARIKTASVATPRAEGADSQLSISSDRGDAGSSDDGPGEQPADTGQSPNEEAP